jgi:hypothetical protein
LPPGSSIMVHCSIWLPDAPSPTHCVNLQRLGGGLCSSSLVSYLCSCYLCYTQCGVDFPYEDCPCMNKDGTVPDDCQSCL